MKNALLRRYFQHRYREISETVVINFNPCDIDQTRGVGIKADVRVPAARIKELIWVGRTKNSEIPMILLKSARAKPDLERATRECLRTRYYYSGSHAPVPTSIERVTSVLRGQKKKRKQWDDEPGTAICQVAREQLERTDGRTDDPQRSSARCTRWRSIETLATSLVTRTFAKSLASWNQRENKGEREENGPLVFFFSHARW